MTEYLKIPEVADLLGLSEQTIRRRVKAGDIPSVFIGGVYRISRTDLNEYLEHARVEPGKESARGSQRSLFNGLEEERHSRIIQGIRAYPEIRAEMYARELTDPHSPHFTDVNTAALFEAQIRQEAVAWAEWAEMEAPAFLAYPDDVTELHEYLIEVLRERVQLLLVAEKVKERIQGMDAAPNEVAGRRLRAAEEAEQKNSAHLEAAAGE